MRRAKTEVIVRKPTWKRTIGDPGPQEGAQPQPSVRPEEQPSPSIAPSAAPTPTPSDALAMLKATPTPAARPTATPQQQRSVYHPMTQAKRMTGAHLKSTGRRQFNTVGTPLGRYQKTLYDAVGSRWYHYVQQQSDLVSIGTAHLVFSVDRSGRMRNVRIVQNTSNESFANVCLRSVIESAAAAHPGGCGQHSALRRVRGGNDVHHVRELMSPVFLAQIPEALQSFTGFFTKGGLFMWPLLICSIVSADHDHSARLLRCGRNMLCRW